MKHSICQILALTGAAILVLPVSKPAQAQALTPVDPDMAVIVNSGSTNTLGYHVFVWRSGVITYGNGNRLQKSTISTELADKFFSDISTATSLSELPPQVCVKSISFGTSTVVEYEGVRSPDLSCPADNAQTQALADDVNTIVTDLPVVVPKFSPVQLQP